jgi:hypothetical protein
VTASRPGYVTATGTATGSSLITGTAPTFTSPVATADGFTFDISNYDPNAMYAISAPAGVSITVNNGHFTVTGLAPLDSATISFTVTVPGSLDAQADITGQALAAVVPTVTPTPSVTPTATPSVTPTATPSVTPSVTPTATPTVTPSATPTVTPSATPTAKSSVDSIVPLPDGVVSPSNDGGLGSLGNLAPVDGVITPTPSDSAGVLTNSAGKLDFSGANELHPGTTTVLIDGHKVTATLDRSGMRATVTAGGLSMELAMMVDGKEVAFPAGSILTVPERARLQVVLHGFKTFTTATTWGFSSPTMLDNFSIASDRSGWSQFTLPESMKPGDHTLAATGTAPDGKSAALAIGIRIVPAAAEAPATLGKAVSPGSSSANWWWLLLLLLIPLAFGAGRYLNRYDD